MVKTHYMQASTGNPFNSQAKMFLHPDRLADYKNTGDSFPILMEINLTNKCPLKCEWCISDYSHNNERIDTDKLINFIAEYKKAGGRAITWSGGGEPTAHPDLVTILKATHEQGIDQGMMTNGVYKSSLNSSLATYLKWIRYSIDTAIPERYAKFKGIDSWGIAIKNAKEIDKNKVSTGINMNLLYNNESYDHEKDIEKLWDLASKIKVHYFQIRPILPRNYKSESISEEQMKLLKQQINYLKKIDGVPRNNTKLSISWDKYNDLLANDFGRNYTKCKGHIFEPVMDANGDIVTCMYHLKEEKFIMGNIYKNSFQDIWSSKKRKDVKNYCDTFDFSSCQVCCKPHEINKLIHFIDNFNDDINFI